MTVIDEIGRSRYVSLTTYRRDGTGVATPVWHVVNGGELFVVSDANAWKVKRIRNDSHVVVTVCGIRGKITPGAPSAPGTARLLDEADTRDRTNTPGPQVCPVSDGQLVHQDPAFAETAGDRDRRYVLRRWRYGRVALARGC